MVQDLEEKGLRLRVDQVDGLYRLTQQDYLYFYRHLE